jgi:hypothetical protein
VQLAASPPATTSTGAFGKYDFMKASTWFGVDFCDNPPRKVPYYRLRPIHFGH